MTEKSKEFLIRSISSVFIVGIILSFIYSYSLTYSFLFIFVTGLMMNIEWTNITSKAEQKTKWGFIGIGYIATTMVPLVYLKTSAYGPHLLMWLFLLVWCVDTFAYIVGKILNLGKHKITSISPKKSYEGLFGGMFMAVIICYIFASIFLPDIKLKLLVISPLLCLVEQISDITESYVKRKFDVKDSGSIIPGHGGMLDRFDGFLFTTLFLILFLMVL